MKRLVMRVAVAAAVFGIAFAGATAAGAGTGVQVIQEKLVVQDPGSDTGNQFEVDEKNHAAMFWVNMFGAQSGAEPVCAMGFRLQPIACIGASRFGQYGSTPDVVLYSRGKRYVLTVAEVQALPAALAWIHRHGG